MTRPLIAPSPGAAVRHRRTPPASLVIGLALIGLVLAAAGISFVWTPFDATLTGPDRLLGPGTQHLLGTDSLGRDILSQLLVGARTTVLVGVISVGVAAVIGVPLGVLAAIQKMNISKPLLIYGIDGSPDGKQIFIRDYKLNVSGLTMPQGLTEDVIEKVQPIIDFRESVFPVSVKKIVMDDTSISFVSDPPPQ